MTVAKRSVKQQLIERIEARLADPSTSHSDRYGWEGMLRELKGRGSGPLPFYFRELAREWGLS